MSEGSSESISMTSCGLLLVERRRIRVSVVGARRVSHDTVSDLPHRDVAELVEPEALSVLRIPAIPFTSEMVLVLNWEQSSWSESLMTMTAGGSGWHIRE